MAQSVKLSDEIMALVRREAELHSRSVAGQISHWLKLGRAIEQSGRFDHARITCSELQTSVARTANIGCFPTELFATIGGSETGLSANMTT